MPAGLRLPPLRKGPPGLAPWRGAVALATPSAPATPSTPSPADTATAYYTLLSWVSAGAAKFDIYLDTVNPPATIVVPKYVGTSYVPTLTASTTYYWKIVAFNDGGSAAGPVWSFTTPSATAVLFSLAGSIVTARARFGSLSIHDVLNAAPNTASLLFDTQAPTGGQAVTIGLGTLDAGNLLFGGEIQAVDQSYVDTTSATVWPVHLIDQTFAINKRRPFGTWVNVSATTIAQYCVAVFAPGFTSTAVQAGLPTVSINFDGSADFMACMATLAQAVSTASAPCYTYVDYAKGLHLFTSETSASPTPLTITNPPLNDPSSIAFSTDLSQIRTRVYGKGHGETVPWDLTVGETLIPLPNAASFTTAGGSAIAATTSGAAQTQTLTYAGVDLGNTSSTVAGTTLSPTTPTTGSATPVGAIQFNVYYKTTWVTARGESEVSSASSAFAGGNFLATYNGAAATFGAGPAGGGLVNGVSYHYCFSYYSVSGEAQNDNSSSNNPTAGANQSFAISGLTAGAAGTGIRIWRTKGGGGTSSPHYLVGSTPADGSTTTFTDTVADSALGVIMGAAGLGPPAGVAHKSATITVANGPSGTIAKRIYRVKQGTGTAANTDPYFLVGTIADNTTTTLVDSADDSALTQAAPAASTVGTAAGSTSLAVADLAQFAAAGWLTSGVRYTGRSASSGAGTLTGIPASGAGSIVADLAVGATVTASPALRGVNSNNGLFIAIAKGASVNIWVQRDDTAAQTALGLLELDDAGLPTDGIREYTISDGRYSEAGLTALCDADLALFSRPIVSATYYTRDRNATSGKTVSIDLRVGIFDSMFDPAVFDVYTGWGLSGSFVIQDVTITFDGPALNPLRQVKASSVSFTLSDLLRRVALV